MILLDELLVVLAPEGAAQAVGLAGRKAGHVYGQLVDLVLEKNDAQGALQSALLQGAIVSHRLSSSAPGQVFLHAAVNAHPRPDRRQLRVPCLAGCGG